MLVLIEGSELPGRRCGPHGDVQGLCTRRGGARSVEVLDRPWRAFAIVAGDAPVVRWECEVVVKRAAAITDFGGPFVLGNRGDRHLQGRASTRRRMWCVSMFWSPSCATCVRAGRPLKGLRGGAPRPGPAGPGQGVPPRRAPPLCATLHRVTRRCV